MGVRKRLEKIVLGFGLLTLAQLTAADELVRDVKYLEKEYSELNRLEVESFYSGSNKNNLYSTFLNKDKEKNIFENSDIGLKSQFVYGSGDRGVSFREGFGLGRQGADMVKDQKLRWFAQYMGKLPLNASLSFFKGENNGHSGLGDIKYREVNIRMPINGKSSPVFFGYGRARVSIEGKRIYNGHIFQLGFKFNF